MEALAPVAPLLRNDQVVEMDDEVRVLEKKMVNPHIEDKGAVAEQLRRIKTQLETQRPRPYSSAEVDFAMRREAELRAEISQGMLSHEEMRKCPPGAVDRHLKWERANIKKIEEWQNIKRRMHCGDDSNESASIEQFRPTANSMNLDNALIQGKQFFLPPLGAALPVTFSNEQLAVLRSLNPGLADMLGTLSNVDRAQVKDALDGKGIGLSEATQDKPKRTLSAKHKAAMKAGRDAKAKQGE